MQPPRFSCRLLFRLLPHRINVCPDMLERSFVESRIFQGGARAEVHYVRVFRPPRYIHAINARTDHIAVGSSVGVAALCKHLLRLFIRQVEWTTQYDALK